jgi:hypothetical protein
VPPIATIAAILTPAFALCRNPATAKSSNAFMPMDRSTRLICPPFRQTLN